MKDWKKTKTVYFRCFSSFTGFCRAKSFPLFDCSSTRSFIYRKILRGFAFGSSNPLNIGRSLTSRLDKVSGVLMPRCSAMALMVIEFSASNSLPVSVKFEKYNSLIAFVMFLYFSFKSFSSFGLPDFLLPFGRPGVRFQRLCNCCSA